MTTTPTTAGDSGAPPGPALAACTIIARNFLAFARTLAESFIEHHPASRFYLLVIDGLPAGVEPGGGIELVDVADLGIPSFPEMTFKYDVTELATAVKPSLLRYLLDVRGERAVVYFDPDILILRPLIEVEAALGTGDIALTPHLLKPMPDDGRLPNERDILIAGAYNLGFIGVRQSEQTQRMLAWWTDRLREQCRVDPCAGLMVDQRWIDLVPGFFPRTTILRDKTYNAAYWNLHERQVDHGIAPGDFLIDGRPIAFFHFSGFDPRRPSVFSKHQTRTEVVPGGPLAGLLADYAARTLRNGFDESIGWRYGFGSFDNGMTIPTALRWIYADLDEAKRRTFGDPFQATGPNAFLSWAVRPRPERAGMSIFLDAIYQMRPDVAAMYPDARGSDRAGFGQWARTFAAREMGFAPELVQLPADAPRLSVAEARRRARVAVVARLRANPRLHRLARGARDQGRKAAGIAVPQPKRATPRPALRELPPAGVAGINVAGYLRDESGVGEAARGYVRAIHSLGVPTRLTDLSDLSPNRAEDRSLDGVDGSAPYDVNLFCVNADQHFVVAEHLGPERYADRYNIGVWFWELPHFPEIWFDRLSHYDEIWVGTSFVANALGPVSPIPIVRVPPVIATTRATGDREAGRRRIGVEHQTVFLFIFDFHSFIERKNPLAAIEAFSRAFTPADPAVLVIKCVNHESNPAAFDELRARAYGHHVQVLPGYWSAADMRDLMAACDAYISLHRSEGLGLTIADAMLHGKPTIATDWSGNADFMHVGNSYPVRYELVKIETTVGPYEAGQIWAAPSVEHAAELMRRVVDRPDEARAMGEAGRRDLTAHYDEAAVATLIRRRLDAIERARPWQIEE